MGYSRFIFLFIFFIVDSKNHTVGFSCFPGNSSCSPHLTLFLLHLCSPPPPLPPWALPHLGRFCPQRGVKTPHYCDWPLIFEGLSKESSYHSSQETQSDFLPGWRMGNSTLLSIQWTGHGPSALEQRGARAPFQPDMTGEKQGTQI